jgi:hypothetical protein
MVHWWKVDLQILGVLTRRELDKEVGVSCKPLRDPLSITGEDHVVVLLKVPCERSLLRRGFSGLRGRSLSRLRGGGLRGLRRNPGWECIVQLFLVLACETIAHSESGGIDDLNRNEVWIIEYKVRELVNCIEQGTEDDGLCCKGKRR